MYFYQTMTIHCIDKHIRSIEKAINGEYSAIHFYARLATLAPDINERTQILEIRQDEQRTVDFYLEIDKSTSERNISARSS